MKTTTYYQIKIFKDNKHWITVDKTTTNKEDAERWAEEFKCEFHTLIGIQHTLKGKGIEIVVAETIIKR